MRADEREAARRRHPAGSRTVCVLVPEWSLEVARRAGRVMGEGPAAVWRQGVVVAANDAAVEEGVRVGQKRRSAEAACPMLTLAESDPGAEAAAFEPLVSALEQVIPRVEVDQPGVAFLSAAGALRYYGGAEATAARVAHAARGAGFVTARVGVARGPFAARAAAVRAPAPDGVLVVDPAAERDFLRALPVSSLDNATGDTGDLTGALHRLGVHTLGQLTGLPRAAVVARFGAAGRRAHRLASGEDRPPAPRVPHDDLAVEVIVDDPLVDLETVAFVGRSLAAQLFSRLSAQGLSAFSVEISSGSRVRTWRALDPLDERAVADRVRWQVAAWTEAGLFPDGLTQLRLSPLDVAAGGRQLSLLADTAAADEAARAYARIQAALGPDSVRRAVLQGGRGPADRHRWVRHGEPDPGPPADRPLDAPWPGRLPDPAPALVLPSPVPVTVAAGAGGHPQRLGGDEILEHAGPWRTREAWWDAHRRRDLEWWQVITPRDGRLLSHSSRGWELHAIYD